MKNNHKVLTALAFAASFVALPALADDYVPSNSLRLGSYSVFYHSSADDLSGPYVPAGVNLKAKDLETLYVGYVRRLTSFLDLELAVGYPPLSKVEGRGPATVGSVPYNGQVISSARWISPTLLLNYNFLSEDSPLRPYVGVGVNYTTYYDRDSTAAGNAANGGPTKISLTASVGPAAEVGIHWKIVGHWTFNASYAISRVNSDIETDTDGVVRKTRIKFGPQALVLAGGYSF